MDLESQRKACLEAIDKLKADPDNEPLPVAELANELSMWKVHTDRMRLFPEQYKHQLFMPESNYYNLMQQQKIAICNAIGYMKYPDARNWKVADAAPEYGEENDQSREDDDPQRPNIPESETSVRSPTFVPSSQCQVEPPGSGKTAVILWLSMLAGRNALVITNSMNNSVQMVKEALKHTNISDSFPIKLIRSNAKEDGSAKMLEEHEKDGREYVMRKAAASEQLHVLDHGGAHGIAIIDANTFQELTHGSSDRHDLRLRIFGSDWDLVVIDEADSVLAKNVRSAFTYGAIGLPKHYELQGTSQTGSGVCKERRYKLKYNKLIAMSGTWHRGEAAGHRFLSSLGPITYSITSKELEDLGKLAKMTVCLVKCTDEQEWVRKYAKEHQFTSLTPEKLRVCERLVKLHVSYGQKVMIFTRHYWHLRLLERMFPGALAISGMTKPDESARIHKTFKESVDSGHPLLWITTTKGEVGMDVPDTCVVINLVGNGESARSLRQQMGRASRKMYMFGWMYSLVGEEETDWASRLAGEDMMSNEELFQKALRYKLLFRDGYGDELIRITSRKLIERADNHVQWMQTPEFCADDDFIGADIVASTANLLYQNLLFKGDSEWLVVLDHVLTCVWGNYYPDERTRNQETLFDTQSQLKALQKTKAADEKRKKQIADKARAKIAKQLCVPGHRSPKRRKVDAKDDVDESSEMKLLTHDEYLKLFPVAPLLKQLKLRNKLGEVLASAGRGEYQDASASAGTLWNALMDIRYKVNSLQYSCDWNRREECDSVLQMGEKVQEKCTFLHASL
jgi:superfamily II DNA or RNA helicase